MTELATMGELRSAIALGDLSGIRLDEERGHEWREYLRRVPADVLVTGARWYEPEYGSVASLTLLDLLAGRKVSLSVCGIEWWTSADFKRYALAWSCGPSWLAADTIPDAWYHARAIDCIAARRRYARHPTHYHEKSWMQARHMIAPRPGVYSYPRESAAASTAYHAVDAAAAAAGGSRRVQMFEQWHRWLTHATLATQPIRLSTKVVHCKRDAHDVYIGRGSIWGNPHRLEEDTDAGRARVIHAYAVDIQRSGLYRKARALRGKRLGCYCAPKMCHGDVLAELADSHTPLATLKSLIGRYAYKMGRAQRRTA